ncbi:helix-turn-helix domain-containing protein [Streptomyces sp. NBC_01498]|uniref:helix-turn-helix domain-containing protein n=1 Tax=Streptomyces sp. NBC_01498 TaxID=2975870 RepID=UPI002E7AB97C|nr:helix-turn-helix domain-containing protein [Streptomyces sp. NBC_01498]WTL26087.1 helix-turn-helix domain-containing protein [Streptomyces sp. NBC_01498]
MESDDRELYSVGEVAERLGLHVRTVRNYVRDGRLKAVRIGKQYRISRADFEALTRAGESVGESAGEEPAGAKPPPSRRGRYVEVSSIVQIDSVGPDAASRLSTFVTASAQSARGGAAHSLRIQTVYDKERARMKIVVLGEAAETADLLTLLDSVLGPGNDLLPGEGEGTDRG